MGGRLRHGLAARSLCVLLGLAAPSSAQVIFQDGFESGDASRWSSVVGIAPEDATAPELTLLSPSGSSVVVGSLGEIVVGYSDAGRGVDLDSYRFVLDGVDRTAGCTLLADRALCAVEPLALGEHSLGAEIADLAGNVGRLERTFTVLADEGLARVTLLSPAGLVRGDATPAIVLRLAGRADPDTLAVAVDGIDVTPSCALDEAEVTCESPRLTAGEHRIEAQVAGTDGSSDRLFALFALTLDLPVAIDRPEEGFLTRDDAVTVVGSVVPEAKSVVVNGVPASLAGGAFVAEAVPLREGANVLGAVASSGEGGAGSASVTVVRDTSPPRIVLRSPHDGFVTTSSQILVTGDVADAASSSFRSREPRVLVNGIEAEVTRKSFVVGDFLLRPGENLIVATAQDAAGNVADDRVRVVYRPEAQRRIEEVQGNGQRAIVSQTLDQPLVVRLVDRIGNPLAQRAVSFEVTRGDGVVQSYPQAGPRLTVRTDARGLAQVRFTLGRRAGEGNHEVTASAEGFPGAIVFCASAEPELPERIKPIPASDHTGATTGVVGKALPRAIFTQVFDRHGNPVPDVLVTWTVTAGNGGLDEELVALRATRTDAEGKTSAVWTLGPEPGTNNNRVEASFAGLEEPPAVFVASAVVPDDEFRTAVVGLVTDNQDRPVGGATVSIEHTDLATSTDGEGRFRLDGAPVGEIHLIVDGSTVEPGTWAKLAFAFTTIPGNDNDLGMPIRLVRLDDESSRIVGGDEDVTLRLAGVPGAELTVRAGSVTFPDGSKTGSLSVTQVHGDKVPMVPPLGSNFMLAWTIQPPGVRFDPPARIAIPNFGDPPGSSVEIFSFDHDLGEFLSIGTATVTPDGSQVVSDPGFGVVKTGWHGCVPPPQPTADVCEEGSCSICLPGRKQPVPRCGECEVCEGGECTSRAIDGVEIEARFGDRRWEDEKLVVGRKKEVVFRAGIAGSCDAKTVYEWDFGDGESGRGREVVHEFEQGGQYRVSVVATCDGCPQAGSADDELDVEVVVVDLELQELPEEDEDAETADEEEPGGFVLVNDDDDNENQVLDRDDGRVVEENDLAELAIRVEASSKSARSIRLDFVGGGEAFRVFESADRTREINLPRTWELDREVPPEVLYLEAVEQSGDIGEAQLRLELIHDGEAVADDLIVLTALDLEYAVVPDEPWGISADAPFEVIVATIFHRSFDDSERLEAVADGAELKWELLEGPGSLEESHSFTVDGVAATTLLATPQSGSIYQVQGSLWAFRLEGMPEAFEITPPAPLLLETADLRVQPGDPASVDLTASKSVLVADRHEEVTLTAVVRDAAGNLVEDETPVSWLLGDATSEFVSTEVSSIQGIARAVLRAPEMASDQEVIVAVGPVRGSLRLLVGRVSGSLVASEPSLDVVGGETIELTLTTNASDGTEVFWSTSNGTLEGAGTVSAGEAVALLSTLEASPGAVVVTATVGNGFFWWEGEFTSSADLYQVVEQRVLVGDERNDGSESLRAQGGSMRTIPYRVGTTVTVHGPPNAMVRAALLGGDRLLEAYTFETVAADGIPGLLGGVPMGLAGGMLSSEERVTGQSSLRVESPDRGEISGLPAIEETGAVGLHLWVRLDSTRDQQLLEREGAWTLQISGGHIELSAVHGSSDITLRQQQEPPAEGWVELRVELKSGLMRLQVGDELQERSLAGWEPVSVDSALIVGGFDGFIDDLQLYLPGDVPQADFVLVGPDAAGLLQLDASGLAVYDLKSQGWPLGDFEVLSQTLTVSFVEDSSLLGPLPESRRGSSSSTDVEVVQVSKRTWLWITDPVLSFLGGDPQTKPGIVSNIAGGLFIVGDVGAVVKNVWRMTAGSEPVNYAELILSGLGLATEFAVGAGELIDLPISAVRSIVAAIDDSPLAPILVTRVRKWIKSGGGPLPEERALVDLMVDDASVREGFAIFVRSEDTWTSLAAVCKKLDLVARERALSASHEKVLKRMASLAIENGDGYASDVAVRVLEGVSEDTARKILQLDLASQLDDSLSGLFTLVGATRAGSHVIDPAEVVRVLDNGANILSPNYSHYHLLSNLGEISAPFAPPALEKLVATLRYRTPNASGYRFELQTAIWVRRVRQESVSFISRQVEVITAAGRRNTDIDVFGNYLYQSKLTAAAFKSRSRVVLYLERVLPEVGGDYSKIIYVVPQGVKAQVAAGIQSYLEGRGAQLLEITPASVGVGGIP